MRSCDAGPVGDSLLLPVPPPYVFATHNYSDDELLESFGSDAYNVDAEATRRKSADYHRGWSRSPRFGRPDVLYLPPPAATCYDVVAGYHYADRPHASTAPRRNASADELETSLRSYAPPCMMDYDDVGRCNNEFGCQHDDLEDTRWKMPSADVITFRTFVGDPVPATANLVEDDPSYRGMPSASSRESRRRFLDQMSPHYDNLPPDTTKPEVVGAVPRDVDVHRPTANVARCARRTLTSTSAIVGHVALAPSCSPEFVVRRRVVDQQQSVPAGSASGLPCRRENAADSSSSRTVHSSPATPVATGRPQQGTSLKAKKREKAAAASVAATDNGGVDLTNLRRANSLAGPSRGGGLQAGDEGFADGRERRDCRRSTYTPRSCDEPSNSRRDSTTTPSVASRASSVPSLGLSSTDRARKRSYRVGLNLFNKNPEQGIQYLRDRNFLDLRPSATAKFLIARKGLSKQMIGEYLGSYPTPFITQVLRSFAQQIDLSNLDIDVALRKFQSYFRMPGEAQKIERIIEVFASQYCACNPDTVNQFASSDTVFLLSFAVMMLNTDLHNKNVRADRKMKLEDFIRNLRGIDNGRDVDRSLLAGMYERIRLQEFMPGEDHVMQVMRVEHMLVGKKPQLSTVLHRRLVCYCRLQEVIDPGRRQRLTQHQREVFLFNDILLVAKIVGRHKNALSYSYRQSLPLTAMGVYLFEGAHYRYGICLTNTADDKVLIMLLARNEHDRKNFVDDLKEAILENSEMNAVESGEMRVLKDAATTELMKQSNVNRYSNDSGVVDVDIVRTPEIAEMHRLTVNGSGRPRPHSVHNSISGSDQGSAASLESGLINVHIHGQSVGMIDQIH